MAEPKLPVSGKNVGEFFAGIGLMRIGLEQAGWRITWANDIDAEKEAMYRGHFKDDKSDFVREDVHLLKLKQLPVCTLVTASFPCNDLSLAGARRGLAGKHSGAFWGFANALKLLGIKRPPLVLLENVGGFLTSNDGNDLRDVCLALNGFGYAVDAFIIDAAHFVPQSRQRLFVVGVQTDARSLRCEETPSFFESVGRPAALADFIAWHPDIRWNVRPLPSLPTPKKNLSELLERLSPNSALWWSQDRAEYLLNQMSPRHRKLADEMINGKGVTYGTVFRRVRASGSMAELRVDGVAGCLRTPRGGSGRQILFAAGAGKYAVRLLSPRECARLMGADDYRIPAEISLNQALFGFGDAVCVPVVRWIAENYLNPLLDELQTRDTKGAPSKSVRYGVR